MMSTSLITCPDRETIAVRALDLLVTQLEAASRQRGQAHLALTGGSSAAALFDLLVSDERARRVDWSRVHVWQGDERYVPWTHEASNWAGARREWLDLVGTSTIPPEHRHPIPVDEAIRTGHDCAWAAMRYAEEVDSTLPMRAGRPAFDVILLGVGADGHIMSTFPGTEPIDEMQQAALAVEAPRHIEPRLRRVTLAPFLLMTAGLVLVMVPGEGKANVIVDCFGDVRDPRRWPAQLALRPNAVWLLEPGSAMGLATGRMG